MEIRIGKEWVIYSAKNDIGIILAKIPKQKQEVEFDPSKLSMKYHYSTVFGAIQGVFKYGIVDSDAENFLQLESEIKRIAEFVKLRF